MTIDVLAGNGFNPLTDFDLSTVRFGMTGFENSLSRCEANGPNLLCDFTTALLGFGASDTLGVLRAKTNAIIPQAAEGTDTIKITGAK